MSAAAQYINDWLTAFVAISTANTGRDGTGTVGTLVTARTSGANGGKGAKVTRIRAAATGTTTAGMLRFFRYNGSAYSLLFEIPVSAITPSATVRAWTIDQVSSPSYVTDSDGSITVDIALAPGDSLRVSTHNAETFHISCDYGEF